MIYTPSEYSQNFTLGNKTVSVATVLRRCKKNMLPSNHRARLIKAFGKGVWVIEVKD